MKKAIAGYAIAFLLFIANRHQLKQQPTSRGNTNGGNFTMKWFYLCSEFRGDPKLSSMTPHHQWAFIILLCLASDNSERGRIDNLTDEEIAYQVRMPVEDWRTLRATFKEKGIIDWDETGIIIAHYWQKFQSPINPYGRPMLSEWRIIRDRIFARDNHTCQYCGATDVRLHCDHVVPISRGGTNDDDNLVAACETCNRQKHDKTPEEWLGGLS